MISLQDRYIGVTKIENALTYVNNDKTTKVCASDIAQFIDEYYPELFEDIASSDERYSDFNYRLDVMRYYSFGEIAADYLADRENMNEYSFFDTLAQEHGYDSYREMMSDYLVICDSAIDGAIVIG